MKIIKEEISFDEGRSIKIFSPRLKNYFYWHYHAEIELVFVEAVNGIRHVGKNISTFTENELILIGGNVPHLNFDYGLETAYNQIVVQFEEKFVRNIIEPTPEFAAIKKLLDKAYLGLTFYGETKLKVVELLKGIKPNDKFSSFTEMVNILQILATSKQVERLNAEDTRVKFFLNDKIRMGTIYNYIHENYDKNTDVNELASIVNLSTPAFCRYFKKQTDLTFTEFVNQYRINQAKTFLLQDLSISDTCYNIGFESLSYFNKLFKKLVGETPSNYKKRHKK